MTNWSEVAVNATSYTEGSITDEGWDAQTLLIDDTFELLIDDTYSLLIQSAQDGTLWTENAFNATSWSEVATN
jgi:hypothetical protein